MFCISGPHGETDMPDLTPEAHRLLADVAQRHVVSVEAVLTVSHALAAGGGRMAQFNHPELGGAGQWSQGGMVMVGDMFNQGLKHRVDALCTELASQLPKLAAGRAAEPLQGQAQFQGGANWPGAAFGPSAGAWWPADLGTPASSGAQNDLRYAYFPAVRRLAIQRNGRLELYDTGEHRISGVSQQQQGSGAQAPTFTSDKGHVRLADLEPVTGAQTHSEPQRAAMGTAVPAAQAEPAPTHDAGSSGPAAGDPIAILERLAGLRQKGILTDAEFEAKKAELLARL
jgi:Short C-terminal domain